MKTLYRDSKGRFTSRNKAVNLKKEVNSQPRDSKGRFASFKNASKKQTANVKDPESKIVIGHADLVIVSDKSSSMDNLISFVNDGVNSFINKQKRGLGEARLSILEFSYSHDINYVFENKPIKEVGRYSLKPWGCTALNDAIMTAIIDAEKRQQKFNTSLVNILIFTDGHENASRKYNKTQVNNKIAEKTKEGWQFQFIGTERDADRVGKSYGITTSAKLGKGKLDDAYELISDKVIRSRHSVVTTGVIEQIEFSDNEIVMLSEDD